TIWAQTLVGPAFHFIEDGEGFVSGDTFAIRPALTCLLIAVSIGLLASTLVCDSAAIRQDLKVLKSGSKPSMRPPT
ncbi:MAG: hypothetical protein KDD59_08460, partial [Bdellovibrionales bacterium]|nr:hypothetical protein [Bdellovibrionales bacterium]